ncbi:MAG TPA: cardiolipin synthase [Verrucomicrobiales bacterium]|jgi:cardiolipin synthase|nr:cardiolipin synthase [Verrucomicrobiales bacterium]
MTIRDWIVTSTAGTALLQWILIPHLLSQRCKSPNSTLAWLWAIIFIPGMGIFYMLMGNERVQRKRLALVRALDSQLEVTSGNRRKRRAILAASMPELERVNGMPATMGNTASLLPDGTSFFPVLLEFIANAKHHLHLEFYIWRNDRAGKAVRDALVKAAQRGVQVRVLLDEIGSVFLLRSFFKPLIAAGGAFSWFHSFSPRRGRFNLNLRNHRKLVIADGLVALTGGMNVADEYWRSSNILPYRDLGVKIVGPLVAQLAEVFAQDWYFSTGQALTAEDYYPPVEPCGEVMGQVVAGAPDNDIDEVQLSTIALLYRAEKRIRLITPYFVPEPPMLAALQLAAMRGVDVALLVPQKCDRFYLTHVMRAYYDDLLPHGVRILEYQPRMIHAKSLTVDGLYTMVGSANLDIRSLRINFELNVLLTCRDTASGADHFFDTTAAEARPVTLEEYQRRPLRHKIAEAVFRPAAPLL